MSAAAIPGAQTSCASIPSIAIDAPDPIEARLEALEIKASYSEDLLDALNLTVHHQQELLDRLVQEVVQLRRQSTAADGAMGSGGSPSDERPPHY